ncbi:hypothetical protein O9G_005424 [Rozella allomycis CSF55]|uniref:UVR domain-containing protein n=1 Tax=Rozella allomycis (strain CSF55) TaxID=988480 RepID=A0A075AW62_ROZAC|nr:hypothetical protein O9G_005424 [Rozella allomycis CSF55]|eukprot:EPZ32947.1 hypothetical protein O9G_005424 [Rozella allomycis CSF55]
MVTEEFLLKNPMEQDDIRYPQRNGNDLINTFVDDFSSFQLNASFNNDSFSNGEGVVIEDHELSELDHFYEEDVNEPMVDERYLKEAQSNLEDVRLAEEVVILPPETQEDNNNFDSKKLLERDEHNFLDGVLTETPKPSKVLPVDDDKFITPTVHRHNLQSPLESNINQIILSPDLLADCKKECDQLKNKNSELIEKIHEMNETIEKLKSEHRREIISINQEQDLAIKRIQQQEQQRYEKMESLYQDQVKQLQNDLMQSQEIHNRLHSLKSSMDETKEIEILTIKKELLEKKEKEFSEIKENYKVEIEALEAKYLKENKELALKIKEKDSQINLLKQKSTGINTFSQTPTVETTEATCYVDTISNSIDKLTKEIELKDDRITNLNKTIKQLKVELEEASTTHDSELEDQLRDEIESLKSSLNNQKLKFENEIKHIVKENDENVAELVKKIRRENDKEISDLKDSHIAEIERLNAKHKKEAETFQRKFDQQVQLVAQRLKEEFSKLYSTTIEKLKQRNQSGANSDLLEKQIESLKNRITLLQSNWDKEKQRYQSLLEETKEALEKDKRLCLEKVKIQYVETLKKIREEVAQSKIRTQESNEFEWKRRQDQLMQQLNADFELK